MNNNPCECNECAEIHSEFIGQFGKFPTMSHADAQKLAAKRTSNEASWDRMMR